MSPKSLIFLGVCFFAVSTASAGFMDKLKELVKKVMKD